MGPFLPTEEACRREKKERFMDRFKRKTAVGLAVSALVALTLGATTTGAAPLATGNHIVPASTTVSGKSTSTVFAAGGITVTCTNSVAGGKTPKAGLSFPIKPLPTFNDGSSAPCTDSFGGTDITTTSGKWTLKFINPTELEIVVPIKGAVVSNSLGCTITVAPTKAYDVKAAGNYDGVSKLTVKITTLPITVTGGLQCPTTATKSSFTATYTFTPGMSEVA
jgi:hypothetical protein